MKIWNKNCGVEKGEDMTEEKKKINKKALLGVGILVALIAVFVVVYLAFGAREHKKGECYLSFPLIT